MGKNPAQVVEGIIRLQPPRKGVNWNRLYWSLVAALILAGVMAWGFRIGKWSRVSSVESSPQIFEKKVPKDNPAPAPKGVWI